MTFGAGVEDQIITSLKDKAIYAAGDAKQARELFLQYWHSFYSALDRIQDNPFTLARFPVLSFPPEHCYTSIEITPAIVYLLVLNKKNGMIVSFNPYNQLPINHLRK